MSTSPRDKLITEAQLFLGELQDADKSGVLERLDTELPHDLVVMYEAVESIADLPFDPNAGNPPPPAAGEIKMRRGGWVTMLTFGGHQVKLEQQGQLIPFDRVVEENTQYVIVMSGANAYVIGRRCVSFVRRPPKT